MTDDQDCGLPPVISVSTPSERHARASDLHVRRWRNSVWRARVDESSTLAETVGLIVRDAGLLVGAATPPGSNRAAGPVRG